MKNIGAEISWKTTTFKDREAKRDQSVGHIK